MSKARAMSNEQREALYLRDRTTLTPAQARRVKHRAHVVDRPHGRPARLGKRHDRIERRKIIKAAADMAAWVRFKRKGGRFRQSQAEIERVGGELVEAAKEKAS